MWQELLVSFLTGAATVGAGVLIRNRIKAKLANVKPPKDHGG